MNQKKLNDSIRNLKSEIDAFVEKITTNRNKVSQIDIDLLLEKLRSSYDVLRNSDVSELTEVKNESPEPALHGNAEPTSDRPEQEDRILPDDIDEDIHKTESEISEIDTEEIMIDISKKQQPVKPTGSESQADLFSVQEVSKDKQEPDKNILNEPEIKEKLNK